MDGPAWKRQRMDDGPGGPSRQDSVFYKTRMCHKYESSQHFIGYQRDISFRFWKLAMPSQAERGSGQLQSLWPFMES